MKTDQNQYENLKKEYVNFFSPILSFFRIIIEYIMRSLKSVFPIFNVSNGDEMVQTYPLGTRFNYRKQFMGMHMFNHDVEKSFAMWRLLKPTGKYIYMNVYTYT
jgi:predicted HAD superfamily hydrolase